MTRTLITLIRHGQTTWNTEGRWQGQADIPLAHEGVQQTQFLTERLLAEEAHFDHLYASDLLRAWDTAAMIATALGMSFHPLPSMREVHLGFWSGLTGEEVKAQYAEQLEAVRHGGKRGEHGESDTEFRLRVTEALTMLVQTHPGQHLGVVTHGGTIWAAIDVLIPRSNVPSKRIKNTSLTTLAYEHDAWQLLRFNDHQHLVEDVELADSL